MQSAQINSPRFSFQSTIPIVHTLDEYRMVHDNYETGGSFSFKAMRPVWIAALLIAAGAGIAAGLNAYSEHNAAKVDAAVTATETSAPSASPVAAMVPMPAETPAASPVTEPVSSPAKAEAAGATSLPAITVSGKSMIPAKARSRVATKPTPAKTVATPAASPVTEITPPQREALPPSPPAPAVIEPLPVPAPSPTPSNPPPAPQ